MPRTFARCTSAALLVWATLAAAPAGAQFVQGRVVTLPAAKPASGVAVRLLRVTPADTAPLPADTTPLAATRTGDDGVFALQAPGTGVYRTRIGDGFVGPVMHLTSADTLVAAEYRMRPGEARALFDFEVERQAGLRGALLTRYPADLQQRGITGRVVVQFVVDTSGLAELRTLRVLESSHPLFTDAVRAALGLSRFDPAQVARRPVRQLVQLPVTFALDGAGPAVTRFGGRAAAPRNPWPPEPSGRAP